MNRALRRTESNANHVAATNISQEALEHEARAKNAARQAIAKRRRNENIGESSSSDTLNLIKRDAHPAIAGCRSVCEFEKLNRIEEGSYGVVSRARNRNTGQIVALKQLKLEKEKQGFPITSLREIHTLMEARHPHIVELKEVVVGDTLSQVYLVMEFVEHDLKTLLSTMRTPFLQSEIKTLMQQILSAVAWMHTRWIVHRDLKTSNLLMTNRGQIKIADFGLARLFGDPIQDMTALVVTLWYRAPELLLGTSKYDTAVDMWSVGCIFSELLLKEPLFQGKNETDQLARIFRLLGKPTESTWPGISSTSHGKLIQSSGPSQSHLPHQFRYCTAATLDLLERFLTYDPRRRISAQEALQHHYFLESPAPAHPDTFGSFPSTAAGEKRRHASPDAPHRPRKSSAYYLEFDFP
ncbi:cyclin-dependent kinase [Malassezia yamatoensis]|uniref:cyclin-dependent kinase n=1 Tax=Malassezia yamatoensis TaxID=253288 RepID=A0AAJ5YUC8_9BASI|nr:cyclin-dependent kinase [Malassezia yamatoensis]